MIFEDELTGAAKGLAGTDAGRALAVVLQAVELLKKERGCLDYENTLLAANALIESITPMKHDYQLREDLAK